MYRRIAGSVAIVMVVFLTITGVVMFSGSRSVFATSVEITGDSQGIVIEPADRPLFTMNNMAPGDSGSSTITVRNEGEKSFTFSISAVKEGGDDILFDGLQIVAADADGAEVYSGPLSGLDGIGMGKVAAGGSEEYTFTVTFPQPSGNEYQGKTLSVKFVFTATGDSGGNGHHDSKDDKDRKEAQEDELIPVEEPEEIIPDLPEELEEPLVEEPIEIIPDAPVVPEVPADTEGELPRTGEFSPGIIHAAGLLLILAGLLLLRRQVAR